MRTETYFISDLHLGARYIEDRIGKEKRIVKWLDSVKDTMKELYLVGDILDYWYDYKYVVPRGFVRFFGKLAELSDAGVKIYWFIGNHDIWLFDYFENEMGITVIDGVLEKEINGKKFFISHGDGVGKRSFGFRFIRGLFRNRFCQTLYSAVHPRWTVPFALGCSNTSRLSGPEIPEADSLHLKNLREFAEDYNKTNKIDYFVFGHLHLVVNDRIPTGGNIVILGDWINYNTYAKFDGNNLSLDYFKE